MLGDLDAVLVAGKRAGLAFAQETKRGKTEIVDSVAAGDIDKLPDDINLADALFLVRRRGYSEFLPD